MSPSSPGYRPDIDGLRAVAVLAVLLFHAGMPGFAGGFVGVDIFFVISGFLITGVIVRELEQGRFSLAGFYERRVRRIVPALLLVILVSTAAAWLIMAPADLKDFSLSAAAAALGVSNIRFMKQRAEFPNAEWELKPLLHSWSLGVEEQFYLLFPLMLILLWRLRRGLVGPVLAGLLLASFLLNLALARYGWSFLFSPPRAWQLLTGGLLAIGMLKPPRAEDADGLAIIGAVMIALAIFLFTRKLDYPGFAALLPTIGAAAIIHAGPQSSIARFLSLKWCVAVGLASYSLYLWHWPIFSFGRYMAAGELGWIEMLGLSLFSGLLAVLTWKFVEQPFRQKRLAPERKALFIAAGVGVALCVGLAALIHG